MPKDGGLQLFVKSETENDVSKEIGLIEMNAKMELTPCKKLIKLSNSIGKSSEQKILLLFWQKEMLIETRN
jgi:hypothetical protein